MKHLQDQPLPFKLKSKRIKGHRRPLKPVFIVLFLFFSLAVIGLLLMYSMVAAAEPLETEPQKINTSWHCAEPACYGLMEEDTKTYILCNAGTNGQPGQVEIVVNGGDSVEVICKRRGEEIGR